jgi:hypothetical protein
MSVLCGVCAGASGEDVPIRKADGRRLCVLMGVAPRGVDLLPRGGWRHVLLLCRLGEIGTHHGGAHTHDLWIGIISGYISIVILPSTTPTTAVNMQGDAALPCEAIRT